MKALASKTDANGIALPAIEFASHVNNYVLAANVAKTVTIPAGARFANFTSTDVFYAGEENASVPSIDVTDGSGSELMPSIRSVEGMVSMSIIVPAACIVSISFFK